MANLLKDFPSDVKKAVLIKQVEINSAPKVVKKQTQKHTLVQIIREWMELKSKQTT